MVDFHRQWLEYDHVTDIWKKEGPKDKDRYPDYDEALVLAIREEMDRFTTKVMSEGSRSLKELLTSRETSVNGPLARLYGIDEPGSGWADATLPGTERAGVLTRAAFLASRAHKVSGSPPGAWTASFPSRSGTP